MRIVVCSALAWLAGLLPGNAETWRSREGQCGEWRGHWNMERGQDGVWLGTIQHEVTGGRCAPASMRVPESLVRAVIVGDHFFAAREATPEGTVCSYFGKVEGDRVRGFELCQGYTARLSFGLRLAQPEGTPGPGQDEERRQTENWLNNPRTYERGEAEPGVDLTRPGRR